MDNKKSKVYISNLKPTSGDALAGSLNIDDIIDKIANGDIVPYITKDNKRIVNYFFSAKKEMDNWGNTHYLVHTPKTVDVDTKFVQNKKDNMPF